MKLTRQLIVCCLMTIGTVVGCGKNDPTVARTTATHGAIKQGSSAPEAERPRGTAGTQTDSAVTAADGLHPPPQTDSADAAGNPQAGRYRYALLVGCTTYYHSDEHPYKSLVGPGNDVLLMRRLLIERYHFPKSHITILSEAQGGKNTPTRKHIEREFRTLAEKAGQAGSKGQFVVLLCGHGSSQPDDNGDEVDGRDETFLPADIDHWNETTHTVANAIVDDELGTWTRAITVHGTSLWVIVDSCHSGTVLRGGDEDEVSRRVIPRDLGVPDEAFAAAKKQAASRAASRGESPPEQTVFNLSGDATKLVAVYAATPTQLAWEKRASTNGVRKNYGLLTYTLCTVLNTARTPLTYRELVARINRVIRGSSPHNQTPLVEGNYQDHYVLGSTVRPPAFTLRRATHQNWQVDGGQLHSLTPGSVLAVYPPPGAAHADKPVGYVKITRTNLYTSRVVPTAYKTSAAPKADVLKEGGRCETVFIDYGSLQTTIAVDRHIMDRHGSHPPDGGQQQRLDRLTAEVVKLAQRPAAVFRIARSFAEAQWIIQFRDGKLVLMSATAAPIVGPLPDGTPVFPLSEKNPAENLAETLRRVARAQNLIALSTSSAGEVARGSAAVTTANVEVTLLKQSGASDQKGKPLRGGNIKLRDRDGIAWRVTNKSRDTVDVTLLFIDSRFGIEPLFPRPNYVVDNRLKAGRSLRIPRQGFIPVNARKSTGREQVVTIAVVAKGPPIDFTALQQPTLDAARGLQTRGAGPRPLETPLGRLLRNACYGGGGTRGLDLDDVDDYQMQLLPWRVLSVNVDPRKE